MFCFVFFHSIKFPFCFVFFHSIRFYCSQLLPTTFVLFLCDVWLLFVLVLLLFIIGYSCWSWCFCWRFGYPSVYMDIFLQLRFIDLYLWLEANCSPRSQSTGWNDKIVTIKKRTWFHFCLMKTFFLLQTI